MKISVNHVRFLNSHYKSGGDPAPNGIDELVAKIGSQLGEVENVETIGAAYHGVVVAKVVACNDHPNADRLHVCLIDDGGKTPDVSRDADGLVQVVCGAPNVRAGMTVAWLPPGSTVPESVAKDPFVLEARELRGVVSNGMLASAKELALGDSHDGILELDSDKEPGTAFVEAYGLDDTIIDIENKMFTHRPDCFGYLGVAREIAGIQGQPYKSPEWYMQNADVSGVET
jgi:phenylalanyl-tRNA synthetase beta chain